MTWLPIITLAATILFLLVTGGGVFPWTVCVAAALTTVAHCIRARPGASSRPPRHRWIEAVYVAVLGCMLLSLLPLPAPMTRLTGTLRHAQNQRVVAAVHDAARLELLPVRTTAFSVTRNRAGTMRVALLLVTCFSCLFLAASLTDGQRRRFLTALCLLGGGLAVAGYVALQIRPQGDTLWWFIPIPHGLPGPVLCFVNRNHFAGYLAMLCPPALGIFFWSLGRRRLSGIVVALAALASFLAMTIAIVLTLSRGAVVAYAGGYIALLTIYLFRRRWIPAASLGIAACALLTTLASFSSHTFKARMDALRNPVASGEFKERVDAWRTCLTIWRAYPLAGAGPNAFRMVFPQHRTTSRREFMLYPENEYAQLLAEGGLVGTLLFALFLAAVVHARPRHPSPDSSPELSGAILAGLAVVALHACFDFAPHLPVYAVTVATMLGFLLGPSDEGLAWPLTPLPALNHQAWPSLLGLVVVGLLSFQARAMRVMDAPLKLADLDLHQLSRAIQWSPVSWQAWFYFGRACCQDNAKESRQLGERCITRAAELDPNNYLLWRELGHLRLKLGMTDAARAAFTRAKELRYWLDVPTVPTKGE